MPGRKSSICVAAVASLFILSIIAPSASALVVGAHSPIALLVEDPDGHYFGCMMPPVFPTADPTTCTSSSSSDFIPAQSGSGPCPSPNPYYQHFPNCDTNPPVGIEADEDPSYYPSTTPCSPSSTTCPTIQINHPEKGTWTVYYYSTVTSGPPTSNHYISIEQCSSSSSSSYVDELDGYASTWTSTTPACTTIETPTFTVGVGSSGSYQADVESGTVSFVGPPPPSSSVPEFPVAGMMMAVILLPILLALRSRWTRQGRKDF